jgi:NAD(P)-dependent dehydrogenase (short-subunit alcohol dehydrogenase family)
MSDALVLVTLICIALCTTSDETECVARDSPATMWEKHAMGLLDGKVAVVTGAGSGMAKASVRALVREGARVVAADISGAEQDTAAEVGPGVLPVHCDVTNEAEIEAMVRAAVEEFGQLDAMLNVVGIAIPERIVDLTEEVYDRIMDVDLKGVLFGMKHGIRAMLQSGGGAIVNWSAAGGLNAARADVAAYISAKQAIIGATRVAAIEYARDNIRVNAICPGYILTEGMGANLGDTPDAAEGAAMNRVGRPEEVAEVAVFLVSDRASFVTGVALPVDGGWSARLA